ncbi:MAG: hypothetical protein COB93_03745 [Sneathiella sp.]|nr:MAG: hypothetical protein COB93_03745 [Sneathiella sp.]
MDVVEIEDRLRLKFSRDSEGPKSISGFQVMPDGHAGLTFGFLAAGSDGRREDYILKVAPFGVRRSGNTDVYRQARLLQVLRSSGLLVPDVPFSSPDETELGTPYIIMERLPGRTFVIWAPHSSFRPEETRPIWQQGAKALAQIHGYDWQPHLSGWGRVRELSEELSFWAPILAKTDNETWRAKGQKLAAQLENMTVAPGPIGVVHGDFQPGNLLYSNTKLTGIIDWELSFIGPQNLDLGWLLMMADKDAWHENWQPVCNVSAEELISVYEKERGQKVENKEWFEALACYRLGAIATLNIGLHQRGKRTDEFWERMVGSVDTLFERGIELSSPTSKNFKTGAL